MPIINLTPHSVTLYSHVPECPAYYIAGNGRHYLAQSITDPNGAPGSRVESPVGYEEFPAAGPPARLTEQRGEIERLAVPDLEYQQGEGRGPDGIGFGDEPIVRRIPVRAVALGAVTGLPAPTPGAWYIVSIPVVDGARREGRTTSDLLTPGDLVRDPAGTIIGVTSFYRWPELARPGLADAEGDTHPAEMTARVQYADAMTRLAAAQQTIADLQRVREAQDARLMEQQRELVALTTTTLGAS